MPDQLLTVPEQKSCGKDIQWNFPKSNLKGPEKKFELRKLRITENTQKIQEKSVFVNFKVR
jgi:hypothetical protein